MWPWGHVAVGYLLYSTGLRRRGRLPSSPEVLLLGFGTLLPDLVDKPLAWTFGVLQSGRSLGHSVLVAGAVLALLYALVAPRVGRSRVTAFAVGYLSHPLVDLPFEAFAGEFATSAYFLWPLLEMPPDDADLSIIAYLLSFEPGPYDWFQFGLVILAASLWIRDGRPGWDALRAALPG